MSLILHPEYVKLKEKLSNLLFEYEDLKNHIGPNIEREYLIQFGLLEFQLYQKDIELKKLKKKVRLIQIQINNGQPTDLESIEKQLKEEFEKYEKNLKKHMKELDDAITSETKELSENDTKKLKEIYRKCILKLHPDLNHDLNENDKSLFNLITFAYKNGDLQLLETLSKSIDDADNTIYDIDDLTPQIEELEKRISELKEKYPYNKKELLSDSAKIEEYKNTLKDLVKDYTNQIELYNEKISKMIK